MAETGGGDGQVFEVFECVELKGRGLRTLKSLKAGGKVLESTPSVFVLSNNMRGHCCDLCFAKREELQRCSKCKFARYCDRECQRKAWNEHKIECERILKVAPNIPTDLVRLMARIMHKMQLDNTFCSDLTQLVSHQEQLGESKKDAFSAVLTVLAQFVGEKEFQKTSPAELFELFGKISCNSFTVCDAELQPLGVGIYKMPSFLNHSCHPNCVIVFCGTRLLIHATENIKQGDELAISYTELLCPSYQRKEDLKSRYVFDCKCTKCISSLEEDGLMLSLQCSDFSCNGAVPRDLRGGGFVSCHICGKSFGDKTALLKAEAIISKSEEALKQIKILEKRDDHEAILELVKNMLSEQRGFFHKLHYCKISLLDKAMDACICLEMWEQALAYGLQTMDAYKLYYPRNHPSVGIQLFRIGKLQVYLDKLNDGFQSLLQAEAVIKITHGNHPIVEELRKLIAQTLEEIRAEQDNRQQGLEFI